MTDAPPPPAQLEPYVRILGVDGAVTFFSSFGGAELVYSQNPRRSQLAEIMGLDAARALAEEDARRGLPRRVPLGKPWVAQVMKSKGLPVAEIARRMHASDVAVRRWLKQQPGVRFTDPRQPSLF
ncbi:MAG: helix-turn-helix domain-containing protein [Pseudotabrizicola sp.]|uniref:helix-turn-helix domain-containing protein n=1 Tax=Pseudotabrizicola sp. TaxID=2939647 RepID=UPI0027202690|nr:helix-turn-helix domain-containing protein [Pseudotabrizicola sp.]MDO9639667.1 helix-turn-helix domain-containing protein [Pseudotabrizicola sp.]